MSQRGARYFGPRQLLLCGRHFGPTAKADASEEARERRARGYFARIVKVSPIDYKVYCLKNEDGIRGQDKTA